MQSRWRKDCESGFVMLETLLTVPMVAILLTAFLTAGLWGLRSYALILSDIELHEEMNAAMQRLMDDMQSAKRIEVLTSRSGNSDIYLVPWTERGEAGEEISYYLRREYSVRNMKLVRNRASNPLTGDHLLARVTIDRFFCEEIRPHVYRVEFIGHSFIGRHRYRLMTMVYEGGGE